MTPRFNPRGSWIIVLSGLIILIWYSGAHILYFWDSAFPFNPGSALQHAFFIWQPQNGIGTANSRELLSIPYYLWILVLSQLFPLYLSQILLTFALFVIGGLGTYGFILDSLGSRQLAATAGGLFYMFNIFVVTTYTFFLNYFFLFAFAPIALLMVHRSLNSVISRKRPWPYVAGLTLAVFLMLPGLSSTIIPFALFFVAYISFWIVGHRQYAFQLAKTALLASVLLTLVNLWWILPVEGSSQSLVYTGFAIFKSNVEGGSYVNLTFLNSLRLLGTVGLQSKFPAPEFWWTSLYTGAGPLGLLSFMIPLIAFSGLLFRRKASEIYFFTLTLASLLALTSGSSFVPGYVRIVESFPALLVVAVNPHLSVGLIVLFSAAYLFGNGVDGIFARLAKSNPTASTFEVASLFRRRLARRSVLASGLIAAILISTIGVIAFPLWTGDLLPTNLPARVTVPEYQQSLANYLIAHDNNDARILSLPLGTLSASNWYVGLDILRWQTGLPILSTFVSLNDPGVALYYRFYSVIQGGETSEFARLLATANIRYVVVHNDAVFPIGFTSGFNLTNIHEFLSRQDRVKFVASFGKVDLYESAVVPGEVFGANAILVEKGNLTNVMLSPSFNPLTEAVVSNAADYLPLPVYSSPSLTFQRVSPTMYRVIVSRANTGFDLVLSETFDEGWNAYVNGKVLAHHFEVNDYANAWFVPNTGSFEILVNYDPQTRVTFGALISPISLVGVFVGWASWAIFRRQRLEEKTFERGKHSSTYLPKENQNLADSLGLTSTKDFLRYKTVLVASFVERWKGQRKATLGMLPYLHDYLKSRAWQTVWLEEPLPGSDDLSLTAEISRNRSQRCWTLPISFGSVARQRNNPSKTYLSLKARDLIGVFVAMMRTRGKVDLFIGVESVNALMGILFRRMGKVNKSVYYIINYVAPKRYPSEGVFQNTIFHLLDRFCAIHSDFVWNQSDIVKQARAKFGLSEIDTAPQLTVPMPIRHLSGVNHNFQSGPEVVYVGTIDEHFGVDLIVKALPAIIKKVPRFRCHFIGDGSARSRLEKEVEHGFLEKNAIFYGYLPQPEADRIMAFCKLGLAPYPIFDPRNPKLLTGHVFTDVGKPKIYLSAGLPVIMTRGIPFSEEIRRNSAGILIDYNVDELAEATSSLLNDSALYEKCRLGAMELAKQYDATQILDRVFSEMASLSKKV